MYNEFIKKLVNDKSFTTLLNGKFNEGSITYNVKVADTGYCCSLSSFDLKSDAIDICFNNDKSEFYIIDKTYKRKKVKFDPDTVEYIGEFKSKLKNKEESSDFGFGHKASGLKKYKTKDFIE